MSVKSFLPIFLFLFVNINSFDADQEISFLLTKYDVVQDHTCDLNNLKVCSHLHRPEIATGSVFNENRSIAFFLLRFYRKFISSQDMRSCIFYPSCSQYAVYSIDNLGFFQGVLMSSDRLLRCNGLARDNYFEFDEFGRVIDLPEYNLLK